MENTIMKKAQFITCPDFVPTLFDEPWGKDFYNNKGTELPMQNNISSFVKKFSVSKEVASATLRATAFGVYDVYLNGINADSEEELLKPGYVDYRHHLPVITRDVTELISADNTFVAVVAPGWKGGRNSFGRFINQITGFCGEIEICYEDGTSEIIASDESFLSTIDGPEKTADIWDGWFYDANVAPAYESLEGKKLIASAIMENESTELIEPIGAQVYYTEEVIAPISAVVYNGAVDNGTDYGEINVISTKIGDEAEGTVLKKGESVIFDFGQNMVGVPSLELSAPQNTTVKCYFAEMLNDSGLESRGNDGPKNSMYIKNYRSALSRVVYVANGSENETILPEHLFYGFRYLEVTADADIEIITAAGYPISSFTEQTGFFSCSDAEVNKLFSNVVWGAKGNYLSVPTDCPQRDERLGWTGDTQIFANAGSYLTDTQAFFRKWLLDARDSQVGHGGEYACVIPRNWDGGGNAAWADAGIIVPDVLYRMYNDKEILKVHYESMCDYIDYIQRTNGLEGPNTAYGDWLNYEHTDKRYIAVCYYAYDCELMIKFSDILAEYDSDKAAYYEEKSAFFAQRLAEIKAHFLEKYFENGNLKDEDGIRTQTTYLLALAFDLIPAEHRAFCTECLKKKIVDNNYTLSTGFVGTGVLAETLQSLGLYDIAYDLLLQTNNPSWLYSVRQGATTIWERWNSYTKETGFGDVGMNSFNHYAYGAVAQWMFDGICGILPDEENPGFEKTFRLCPTPDFRSFIPEGQSRMTHAEATYSTAAGEISSSWYIENGVHTYEFIVPAGLTAEVGLLNKGDSDIEINGIAFSQEQLGARAEGDRIFFTIHSGFYTVK